jgi:MFS family permease
MQMQHPDSSKRWYDMNSEKPEASPALTVAADGHLRAWRQALAAPGRYIRPWYGAYLLLGIVTAGMAPVLLPLMMVAVSHQLDTVAYVMGAYDFGLLSSPLWGMLAERRKLYRGLFFSAFLIGAAAVAIFPLLHSLPGWMAAGFVLGAGSAGAAMLASLFILDFTPQNEWESRIGFLQSFNGAGQVVGLLFAAAFSHGQFELGLWLAALLLLAAMVIGGISLPVKRQVHPPAKHPRLALDARALAAFPRVNFHSGIGFHLHHWNMHGLRQLPEMFGTPFGRFILSWFLLALGVAGFFTYFPLMLEHGYGLNTHLSSLIYAIMAAVGIALYVLASRWAARLGSGKVYQIGLWVRLIGFVLLVVPYLVPIGPRIAFAVVGFALIVVAWPLLSVAGIGLAARLSPFSEGAAVGLFNASFALATVIGAFASGPLMAALGYRSIAWMGALGLVLAILSGLNLAPKRVAETGNLT